MVLEPGGIVLWLVVGLVAGWMASKVMRGGGYGLIGDVVLGIIGAFVGSFVAGWFGFGGQVGLLGSILVAFVGAVILLGLLRVVRGRSFA